MAGFSEEDIRRVREANDLVDLFSERTRLQQRGKDFWCCCPFHQEKTPSCKIDSVTQTWHCFGCGEGGDIISYIQKLDDVDFVDALRFLARRANIELQESATITRAQSKKARLKEVCRQTADFYHTALMRSPEASADAARSYLAQRGLGGSVPKTWWLGFAPGRGRLVSHLRAQGYTEREMLDANVAVHAHGRLSDRFYDRIMFPINDVRGECIAFGGRVIGSGEPKYLNSTETPLFHKSEVLFGLDKAKASMAATGDAIVVEGYTDVIALHEAGITNVVATLGTSLTRQHIRLISHHAKSRIIYLFDGDEAGQRAADRALGFIDASITPEAGASKIDLCAVTLPGGLDPAEFVASDGGDAALRELLEHAQPLIRYGIDRRLRHHDLETPEGRSRATVDALSILAPIKTSLLAKDYAVYIASKTHVREQDVLARLDTLKASVQSQGDVREREDNPPRPRPVLTTMEKNRLKAEREFLSLCSQNPAMVAEFLNTLGQTNWHDRIHRDLADIVLDILSTTPDITVAELIGKAQERNPLASRVLTSSVTQGIRSAHDSMKFLADELMIGDMEEVISSMRGQIKSEEDRSDEEQEALFQSIVALQHDLNMLRSRHGLRE